MKANNNKLIQFRHMQMWYENKYPVAGVWSYDIYIGYIDYSTKTLYEWGYGVYSPTTSKQITVLCNCKGLTRKHIKENERKY